MNKATENTEFTEIDRINKNLRLKKLRNCEVKTYFIKNFLVVKELK